MSTTDVLRGAVVFLHASLEDLLRSLLEWKLPLTSKLEDLKPIPLAGEKPGTYTLADVAKHRGSTVDELIDRSVKAHLERSNYNNVAEIAGVLAKVGVANSVVAAHGGDLEAMMKRRHWIVHRADRNPAQGQGQFPAQSLHPNTVKKWTTSVEAFGKALLALL